MHDVAVNFLRIDEGFSLVNRRHLSLNYSGETTAPSLHIPRQPRYTSLQGRCDQFNSPGNYDGRLVDSQLYPNPFAINTLVQRTKLDEVMYWQLPSWIESGSRIHQI